MCVGDGMSVSIEEHKWVNGEQVKKNRGAGTSIMRVADRVADLMMEDKCWNPTLVWGSFDTATARKIMAIHVSKMD